MEREKLIMKATYSAKHEQVCFEDEQWLLLSENQQDDAVSIAFDKLVEMGQLREEDCVNVANGFWVDLDEEEFGEEPDSDYEIIVEITMWDK